MENKKTGFAEHPENINRNGRPKKGETLTDLINEYGNTKNKSGKELKAILIKKIWDKAIKGNNTMMKYICDRIDGFPAQTLKHDMEMEKYSELSNALNEIYRKTDKDT